MTQRLKEKVAVITGAASGIGHATVLRFLEEGALVVATDVDQSALEALAEEIGGISCHVEAITADVTRRADTEEVVKKAVARFGRVDILVNSAQALALSNVDGVLGEVEAFRDEILGLRDHRTPLQTDLRALDLVDTAIPSA